MQTVLAAMVGEDMQQKQGLKQEEEEERIIVQYKNN